MNRAWYIWLSNRIWAGLLPRICPRFSCTRRCWSMYWRRSFCFFSYSKAAAPYTDLTLWVSFKTVSNINLRTPFSYSSFHASSASVPSLLQFILWNIESIIDIPRPIDASSPKENMASERECKQRRLCSGCPIRITTDLLFCVIEFFLRICY